MSTRRRRSRSTTHKAAVVVWFGLTLGFTLFLSNGIRAENKCPGPITGHKSSSEFNFTYESWMKKQHDDDVASYRFMRCVHNRHRLELWVDWESTGLKGTSRPQDVIHIFFDEPINDNVKEYRKLWYGPRPKKLEPKTILRPNEARTTQNDGARLYFAQLGSGVSFTDALADQRTMTALLENLRRNGGPEGLSLRSGGRVAVPTRPDTIERLKRRDKLRVGEFVAVDIVLLERFTLFQRVPHGSLHMSISIKPSDWAAMVRIGGSLPPILVKEFDGLRSIIRKRLQLPIRNIVLKRPLVRFQQETPSRLMFPVQRKTGRMLFWFGDETHLFIPFGVASGH